MTGSGLFWYIYLLSSGSQDLSPEETPGVRPRSNIVVLYVDTFLRYPLGSGLGKRDQIITVPSIPTSTVPTYFLINPALRFASTKISIITCLEVHGIDQFSIGRRCNVHSKEHIDL